MTAVPAIGLNGYVRRASVYVSSVDSDDGSGFIYFVCRRVFVAEVRIYGQAHECPPDRRGVCEERELLGGDMDIVADVDLHQKSDYLMMQF